MNWSRSELKQAAKNALHHSYWKSVLVAALLMISVGGACGASSASQSGKSMSDSSFLKQFSSFHSLSVIAILSAVLLILVISVGVSIFILGPLEVGCQKFFSEDVIGPTPLDRLSAGFSSDYMNVVKTIFLRGLYILLWSLLLLVPGLIKMYEYRMVPYILAENPGMSSKEVFALSKKMMDGEKMHAFVLDLSFIPWYLLSMITCGLAALFYVSPYVALTDAALFHTLQNRLTAEAQAPVPDRMQGFQQ